MSLLTLSAFAQFSPTSETGDKVLWNQIKWLRFEKENPTKFKYKDEMNGEFQSVDTRSLRKQRPTTSTATTVSSAIDLSSPYSEELPIS